MCGCMLSLSHNAAGRHPEIMAALLQPAFVLAGLFSLDKETRRERAELMRPQEDEEPPYWELPPWLVSLFSCRSMTCGLGSHDVT